MLMSSTTWFVYAMIFAAGAALLNRTAAVIGLVLATVIALPAALLPLSNCAPWRPSAGEYTVLGARIDVPSAGDPGAIWAFLDGGDGEPRCYMLPYSTGKANALQEAMDGDGGVKATIKGDGGDQGEIYDGEPPVSDDVEKQVEQPQVQIPG